MTRFEDKIWESRQAAMDALLRKIKTNAISSDNSARRARHLAKARGPEMTASDIIKLAQLARCTANAWKLVESTLRQQLTREDAKS